MLYSCAIPAHLQFVLDAANFDGMLVLLDVNGHRVEVMYFETLVGNRMLVLDLMVVMGLGIFRLMESGRGGARRVRLELRGVLVRLRLVLVLLLRQMRLGLLQVIVVLVLAILVYNAGQHRCRAGE